MGEVGRSGRVALVRCASGMAGTVPACTGAWLPYRTNGPRSAALIGAERRW
jgi:hypothetical protein